MVRIIALLILLIPGILAGYGIKLMRDMILASCNPRSFFIFAIFSRSSIILVGLGFVAGFILHRDRKRNKVQNRFQKIKTSH
ncbi:DUF2627 domain-containing protein [Bacillus megaterium]|nr:DUF2627 domain-containing protein [Priestia megaterium]